ncbi:MAG: hypothetical protein FJ170_06770, partial [Gammaproteobacteria bacterium]|nr:hypothetical protein [Gammaproteobacteria bacterium]
MTIKIIDCTLRDGGYYNDWNFARETVMHYLAVMGQTSVDVVEIGFRFFDQDRFIGPYGFSTDAMIESLPIPANIEIGVMVNAKEMLAAPGGAHIAVGKLFANKASSPVSLVRIATHFGEAWDCCGLVDELRKLGYRIGLNIMQANRRDADELTRLAADVAKWQTVDVLYFADSMGNMDPAKVRATVIALRRGWSGPLGIHTHDNMGMALVNTLAAMETGVTWLDATVLGMGRGAGNLRTEILLMELSRRFNRAGQPEALFSLVLNEFDALHRRHGWGPSLLYYLAAAYEIHPSYVQVMLQDDRYRSEDVLTALHHLKDAGGHSYSTDRLQAALESGINPGAEGSWNASGWARDRTVLVIGPGKGIRDHQDALLQFIARTDPLVVCLNATTSFPRDQINLYAACHLARQAIEAPMYRGFGRPVAIPVGNAPESIRADLADVDILNYGLKVQDP